VSPPSHLVIYRPTGILYVAMQEGLNMKYGHFDDEAREYVIETPKLPYPWINYLGTDRFFGLISHTGGGYDFYRDALLRRITRYRYNNVPTDAGGRYFYVVDGDDAWTPGWMPMKSHLDLYECRHGLGYSTISSARNGLEVKQTYLVPLEQNVEIRQMALRNSSAEAKSLKVFSLVEWCLWNAQDDMTNFQRNYSTGEVEVENSVIYHKTEYRERRNHYAYYSVNRPIQGFDTDRESFLGPYNGFHEPRAVLAGKPGNSLASGWAPIASHYLEIELPPGAEETLIFVLGYAENPADEKFIAPDVINKSQAVAAIEQFSTPARVSQAMEELREYWDGLLGTLQIECDDEKLQRMVNIWNPYQCMITYHFSRSASFFESGIGRGMGFRDSNQDLLGVVHQIPTRARERILDIAATQLRDGGAYHQYQPLTKRGNDAVGDNFNDDPLWLLLSVTAYVRETGDVSILQEIVPYENDDMLAAPLLDHLWRSLHFTKSNLGPHGLPLIGRADWNDCLNLNCHSIDPDESFQTGGSKYGDTAESLMIAGLFCYAGSEFANMLDWIGQVEEVDAVRRDVDNMRCAVDQSGRDGAWFLRAYDANGGKVGSAENEDGQIYIESQGWCIMGGCGIKDGFAARTLDSVKERLDTKYGIVLLQPAYKEYHEELGEVSSYPPGYKENAGIFCHNNPWIVIAETMMGNAERAFEYYRKICPAYLENISELHRTEPYIYSQMIAGCDAERHGEAKNSWLTGTAAWNYVAATQHLLGIRAGFAGLHIRPCLPLHLNVVKIIRSVRGIRFRIKIKRGHPDEEKGLFIDGAHIEGDCVPYSGCGEEQNVDVVI